MESEYVLHQFLMLSARELKLVIEKIPEMIKETLLFEPTVGNAKLVIDETVFQPTDVEEKTKFDVQFYIKFLFPGTYDRSCILLFF